MEIHQLKYFCAVAKVESFTRAAKNQNVSQPSLSQQILKLEDELGAKLFDRLDHRVKLSRMGELFLPQAQAVLTKLEDVKAEIKDESCNEAGEVVLGITGTISPYFLPQRLATFLKLHASIKVRVVEEISSALLERLHSGSIDSCIVACPVEGKDLLVTEIVREPLFAVVPEGSILASKSEIGLRDFANMPFLYLKDFEFAPVTAAAFGRAKTIPQIVFESACFLTITAMVCSGIGVSVVPQHAVIPQDGCVFLPISDQQTARRLAFVQLKNRYAGRAQQTLADFLSSSSRAARRDAA